MLNIKLSLVSLIMLKETTIEEIECYHRDFSCLEEFLLAHSYSKDAFINLSRVKEVIRKEELLDEIKRLIKVQILKQIRMTGFP